MIIGIKRVNTPSPSHVLCAVVKVMSVALICLVGMLTAVSEFEVPVAYLDKSAMYFPSPNVLELTIPSEKTSELPIAITLAWQVLSEPVERTSCDSAAVL